MTSNTAFRISAEIDDLLLLDKIDLWVFENVENQGLLAHNQHVGIILDQRE